MIIPVKQMQNIVEELEGTIQKNINIMDENGCIIASSDFSRIGTYHSGAQQVINENLDELVICSQDEYAGAKNGINLPIIIDDKIVGVVGITGKIDEVKILGKIIQKMTKILIMDNFQNNEKKTMESKKNDFIFNWLFVDEDKSESEENITLRGSLLGIDIGLNRVVAVMSVESKKEDKRTQDFVLGQWNDTINREINWCLKKDSQHLFSQIGGKKVIFFHSSDPDTVMRYVGEIAEAIEKKYDSYVYCGIGTVGTNRMEIRRSYREANTACNLAVRVKNNRIKLYSDTDIELLLQNISRHDREVFVKRIFKDCQEDEIRKWVEILRCYAENNGSITKTAEDCFIHKNTLQYRLTRLKDITGYDPRIIKESLPLYMAMLLYEIDCNN